MNAQLLENDGRGVFDDASSQIGDYFVQPCVGRGAAKGDFDNDGQIDIVVSHVDRPMAMIRNQTQVSNHFIGLQLLPIDRVYPVGGQVIVMAGGQRHIIPIIGGGSYLSSSDPRIVVGLGEYAGPVDVSVVWPGRGTEAWRDMSSGQYWQIREGKRGQPSLVLPVRDGSEN